MYILFHTSQHMWTCKFFKFSALISLIALFSSLIGRSKAWVCVQWLIINWPVLQTGCTGKQGCAVPPTQQSADEAPQAGCSFCQLVLIEMPHSQSRSRDLCKENNMLLHIWTKKREREREREIYLYLSSGTSWPSISFTSKSKIEEAFFTKSSISLAAGSTVSPAPWRACSQLNWMSLLLAAKHIPAKVGVCIWVWVCVYVWCMCMHVRTKDCVCVFIESCYTNIAQSIACK